jgi:RNA polymerase sigma factor (sigma-70 family)
MPASKTTEETAPRTPAGEAAELASLIQAHRRGEDQALARLYEVYYPQTLRFARRYTASPGDAEDLAQDAFMGVAAALRRGDTDIRHFPAYLATSVRRLAGRRAQRKALSFPVEDISKFERPAVEHLPDDGDLDVAFNSLSERHRTALWLRVVEGRPRHEVGELLGVSAAAAGMTVHRGLAELRAAYQTQRAGAALEPV